MPDQHNWPHSIPFPAEDWLACAPYNFVRLPEKVVPFSLSSKPFEHLPRHDTFYNKGFPLSGRLIVDFETLTPTYTRGPLHAGDYRSYQDEAEGARRPPDFRNALKNRPEFFHTGRNGEVSFPGRSIRGMLRALAEIISFGKIDRVANERGQRQFRRRGQPQYFGQGPLDFIPPELRDPDVVDMAEALFGYVRSDKAARAGSPRRAYRGRVRVTSARLALRDQSQDDIFLSGPIIPPILSEPKANTAYQHYLVQTAAPANRSFDTQIPAQGNWESVIRGHKGYWFLGERGKNPLTVERDQNRIADNDRLHTQFRPLKKGIRFQFEIHFTSLAERELGLLLWALLLPADRLPKQQRYAHQLGMGKPLGMGAVKIGTVRLQLENLTARYAEWQPAQISCSEEVTQESLLAEIKSAKGEKRSRAGTCVFKFEQWMRGKLELSVQRLSDHPRVRDLLALHSWPGFPPHPERHHPEQFGQRSSQPKVVAGLPNTRYMARGEHSRRVTEEPDGQRIQIYKRPVLPTPEAFDGRGQQSSPPASDATSPPSRPRSGGQQRDSPHRSERSDSGRSPSSSGNPRRRNRRR